MMVKFWPFTINNLFIGLGFANFMASSMVGLYYNMIIAWTIYYMFASFTSKLPWEDCGQDFNSDYCFSITDYANCTAWRDSCKTHKNCTYENLVYHKGWYYLLCKIDFVL